MVKNNTRSGDGTTSLTAVFLMVFSGAMLLLLIGLYLVLGLHSENIVKYLKEHTAIVFELEEGATEDVNALIKELEGDERLRQSSVEYISASEGLAFMQKEMGSDLLPADMENPFKDLISSFVLEAYTSDEALESIRTRWSAHPGIAKVYFQNDYLTFWDEWRTRIARITTISALFLLLITVLLIFNTVKLSIFTRQESIEILELVGADWDFIRQPFLRVSVKMGVISALMASIIIAIILSIWLYRTPGLIDYFNWYYMVITIVILLIVGVILQWTSTYIVVNRSLKHAVSRYK